MGSGLFISRVRLITAQSPQGALALTQPCTYYQVHNTASRDTFSFGRSPLP